MTIYSIGFWWWRIASAYRRLSLFHVAAAVQLLTIIHYNLCCQPMLLDFSLSFGIQILIFLFVFLYILTATTFYWKIC